jgi:hypothetical protein
VVCILAGLLESQEIFNFTLKFFAFYLFCFSNTALDQNLIDLLKKKKKGLSFKLGVALQKDILYLLLSVS